MANKKISSCAEDAIFAGLDAIKEVDAKGIASTYLKQTFGPLLSGKANDVLQNIEAIGIGPAEVAGHFQTYTKTAEKFTADSGATAGVAQNSVMYERDVKLNLVTQHVMAEPAARIVGQTRRKYPKSLKDNWAQHEHATEDAVARISASEAAIRSSGIPIVIAKAAAQAGPNHFAFLSTGDIGRVFLANGKRSAFSNSVLRSANPMHNIQFQNMAEAVRRIVEQDALGTLDSLAPADLQKIVEDALTIPTGKPVPNPKNLALIAEHNTWLESKNGKAAVTLLRNALTDPKIVDQLIAENTRMSAVTIGLAKADGFWLSASALSQISELPSITERLHGYGNVLTKGGIKKIFRKDALAALQPEQLNLAFADNAAALFFSHLSDESLIALTDYARKADGMAADAAKNVGKTKKEITKTGRNQAKKGQTAEISKASEKQAAEDVAGEPNIRVGESSVEAASISRRYFLEFANGSMIGGAVKAISKVSDISTAGSKLKTMLIGTEHLRLENSAIVTSELKKVADKYGQDVPMFNRVFKALQGADHSGTVEQAIAKLPTADHALAKDLMYFVEHIFSKSDFNKLTQEGVYIDEMVNSLRMVGQNAQALFLEGLGKVDPAEIGAFWKQIEIGAEDNAIETLSKYYAAMQLSLIKPTIASYAVHHFGHVADNLTYNEAIAQGYKPISNEGGFSGFLATGEQPPLFHPDTIAKLQQMNYMLDYERGFKSGAIQKIVNVVDPIVSILKSSVTIWRPGHHMTSIIGNTLFNTLAGVRPHDYAIAMRVMKQHGMIDHLDEGVLAQIEKNNIPEGYVFKGNNDGILIPIRGKNGKVTMQSLNYDGIGKGATAVAGVRISEKRAKDVVDQELQAGTVTNILMKNPLSKGVGATDHQIARFSAARDNIARYALFVKELQKGGPYNSLEDAFLAAGSKVHEFHPTVGTLTSEERKVARRLFYFYTWQKQAFFKIMEMAANTPAFVAVPSKLQFAIAESQGLNPASFGDPFDPTALFAGYNSNSVYGPQWNDPTYGAAGIKPSLPQLDVIDSYLSVWKTKPQDTLWENIGNFTSTGLSGIVAQNMNPLFKIPAELATGNKINDVGKITDVPQYLLDQTGASALSRATGLTPWGTRSDIKPGAYETANRERQMINYWLGVKFTYYQSPAALTTARQEQLDYWQKTNKIGKYAPTK